MLLDVFEGCRPVVEKVAHVHNKWTNHLQPFTDRLTPDDHQILRLFYLSTDRNASSYNLATLKG